MSCKSSKVSSYRWLTTTNISVEQELNFCDRGENVNTFYLTLVRRGMLLEIDALFKLTKVVRSGRFSGFDKDYVDNYGISALTAAIYLKDEGMTRKLIENGVWRPSLFIYCNHSSIATFVAYSTQFNMICISHRAGWQV